MLTFIHLKENVENKSSLVCWKTDWISPYESPWGIFEKFKHANEADMKDVIQLFGKDEVRVLKKPSSKKHRDLIHLGGFDQKRLSETLQYDLFSANERDLNKIVGALPEWGFDGPKNPKIPVYFRKTLAYCEQCIQKGYHSLFHQFVLVNECPYHLTTLKHECPSCNTKIPYLLVHKEFRTPFVCSCGHHFLSMEEGDLIYWKETSLKELRSDAMKKWINLTDLQVQRLSGLFLDPNFDWESIPNALEKIYSLISNDNESSSVMDAPNQCIHYTVTSSSYIKKIKGIEEKDDQELYTKKNYPYLNSYYIWKMKYHQLIKEMNKSFEATINGLAKHIRQELKEHRTCIRNITRALNEKRLVPICPYAYAYLNWRRSLQNYRLLEGVDNFGFPDRSDKTSLNLPAYFSYLISELFDHISNKTMDITLESRASLKWLLNRVIIHFAYYYYTNWLKKSSDLANRRVLTFNIPFDINDVPFFIIKLPQSDNECYEFHWWKGKNSQIDLLCSLYES